jgi:hypothetical protein
MNSLLFGYVKARQDEILFELSQRSVSEEGPSLRDRIGRTLINWGEHLVAVPRQEPLPVRPAA